MFEFAASAPPEIFTPTGPWTAERYLETVHPLDGRGAVGGLTITTDGVRAHTLSRDLLAAAAATLVEQEAYVAMNPYFGPRGDVRRLAGLNALWLDLDTYRVPELAALPRPDVQIHILTELHDAALPPPSLLVDSGRGFHCVWLIRGASAAALPRWSALMKAFAKWAKPLGADPACVDPARVLRLPGSWHEEAGRQVTVVAGDGARHPFEVLADAVWRVAGRPTRQDYDAMRSAPRTQNKGAKTDRRPRGLPRTTFWGAIRHDLDTLLDHWGGVVPVGLRDLWLNVHCCALTWTDPGADILDLVLARAAAAAPGLTRREVGRMMGSTIRRGVAARTGQPRAYDPRYDYASDRLCEFLGVDGALATKLGLRQLIPADLRADRNRRRRAERRRAEGALPRAIWLAAHPTNRLKPWEAEGISRATWYRRQREARWHRLRACVAGLWAGPADLGALHETRPVSLYKGVAHPAAGTGPACGVIPAHGPGNLQPSRDAREKTTRTDEPRRLYPERPRASASVGGDQSPASTPTEIPMTDRPALDFDVLKAAAQRLSHTELGALTAMALALAGGAIHRRALGRRSDVPPEMVDRLDGWLRISPDAGLVTGLIVPGMVARPTRGPRQGLLFEAAAVAPTPVPGGRSHSLRAHTIAAGVRLLGRAGIGERVARSFIGKVIKEFGFGALAEAIDALEPGHADVAEPRSWIRAYITKRRSPDPTGGPRGGHPAMGGTAAPMTDRPRPLATPEFLGISPGRAAEIQERNRRLAAKTRLFSDRLGQLK